MFVSANLNTFRSCFQNRSGGLGRLRLSESNSQYKADEESNFGRLRPHTSGLQDHLRFRKNPTDSTAASNRRILLNLVRTKFYL
jgi:hypothetical protein